MPMKKLSLIDPPGAESVHHKLPPEAQSDLSVDFICAEVSGKPAERALIKSLLTGNLTSDPRAVEYRCAIFEDVYRFPGLCERVQELLDKIDFLRSYGSFLKENEEASSLWELIHRLNEIGDYIVCIEELYDCLCGEELRSEGLCLLRDYVREIYEDSGFAHLKKDIAALKQDTERIRSVTLGVNLNERYEPNGVGIISVNSRSFQKTGIISNFCDFLGREDDIQDSLEVKPGAAIRAVKDENKLNRKKVLKPLIPTLPEDPESGDLMNVLDRVVSHMLAGTTKKLKRMLSEHVEISSYVITSLIPQFMFYVRFAAYIRKCRSQGFAFCRPQVSGEGARDMQAEGLYNLKLIKGASEGEGPASIVPNDLDFCAQHRLYILTGANRGGKTTLTQAVGIAFLLAQNGIFVPAQSFRFSPADNIFTHFPADENKTMDLGRLGEEAKRFRELYTQAGAHSLILLNESFSSTSFEEGFYIAYDVVKSLKLLGARTIYNTHMHKLAQQVDELNGTVESDSQAASLMMGDQSGSRSYKVHVAPPEGRSYAQDIARKYGVTFEQLTGRA